MYCARCGQALPSHGFICPNCGAMLNNEQIKKQQEYMREEEKNNHAINLLSDKYKVKKDNIYKTPKDNKMIGIVIILVIVVILLVIAILKVMD